MYFVTSSYDSLPYWRNNNNFIFVKEIHLDERFYDKEASCEDVTKYIPHVTNRQGGGSLILQISGREYEIPDFKTKPFSQAPTINEWIAAGKIYKSFY